MGVVGLCRAIGRTAAARVMLARRELLQRRRGGWQRAPQICAAGIDADADAHEGADPGPIVPALVTPPLKVVWLITIAVAVPLKTVGYGPLNAIGAPSKGVVAPRRGVPIALTQIAAARKLDRTRQSCLGSLSSTPISVRRMPAMGLAKV
jgi:hypothetical protein